MKFVAAASRVMPLFAVLFLLGCNGSTTPEDNDPPGDTLIDSWTIGAAGGTLTGGSFSIEIPAGALAADTEINLYASTAEQPFGDNPNTALYKLEGLSGYAAPIRVALRYSGAAPASPFLARGTAQTNPYDQESSIEYDLIAAADSSGYLVAYLPPDAGGDGPGDKRRTEPGNLQFLMGLLNYHELMAEDYFRILYPNTVSDPEGIREFLMELRSIIVNDLEFDFRCVDADQDLVWPINVLVQPLGGDFVETPTLVRLDGAHHRCTLKINENVLEAGSLDLSVSAGKDLLYTALFVESGWSHTLFDSGKREWFNWAIRDWSEKVFTVDDGYAYPASFTGSEFAMFPGLPTWAAHESYWGFVRGMSAFVEYLTRAYGLNAPATIYESMAYGDLVFDAIASATGTPFGRIWREFCTEYLKRTIYEADAQLLIQQGLSQDPPRSWRVQGPDDVTHDFGGSTETPRYGGLEARSYAIDFDSQDFGEISQLKLSTANEPTLPDIPMQVYRVTDERPVLFASNVTSLSLDLHADLFDEGIDQVLVLLVNEDYNPENIDATFARDYLSCRIVQEYEYPSLYVRIFVDADMVDREEGGHVLWENFGYYNEWLSGGITGDQFEYSVYDSGGDWWTRTTATGRIDLETGEMTDFVIETDSESYAAGVLVAWEHKRFDLTSGLTPGFGSEAPMTAVGYSSTCQYIESFEYASQSCYCVGHSCGAESTIRLEWYTE